MKTQIVDKITDVIKKDINYVNSNSYHICVRDEIFFLMEDINSNSYYWINLDKAQRVDDVNFSSVKAALSWCIDQNWTVYELTDLSELKELL